MDEEANILTPDIQTFLFFDCETTGLPCYEYNRTKITELCLESIHTKHLLLQRTIPRVRNHLLLNFNPNKQISPMATEITGLSNDLLEIQSSFTDETVKLLNNFISMHQKPVCLVAHNGNKFDFPILQSHIANAQGGGLSSDLLCVDSLDLFREIHKCDKEDVENQTRVEVSIHSEPSELNDGMDEMLSQHMDKLEEEMTRVAKIQQINETTPKKNKISHRTLVNVTSGSNLYYQPSKAKKSLNYEPKPPSFKLVEVYKRLLEKEPADSHRADGDVRLMVECAAFLGEKFVQLANKRAKPFNKIPPLNPLQFFK